MTRRSDRPSKARDFYDPSALQTSLNNTRNGSNISKLRRKGTPALVPANALNTNSPILKIDIQKLFATTILAWPTLAPDVQRRLISTFPPKYRTYEYEEDPKPDRTGGLQFQQAADGAASAIGTAPKSGEKRLKCPLSASFVAEDEVVRRDVARFKRDVENGFYLKKWQEEGNRAMGMRVSGGFDDFVGAKAEREFGEVSEDEDEAEVEVAVAERSEGEIEGREMLKRTTNGKRSDGEEHPEKDALKRAKCTVEMDGEMDG